ncbi:hypothetical protein BG011_000320 [Mortierella polycephala]|uniref:Uncharacterized protein n=1 Tax=Mortierella polycephala TaxID=41804 RepID=A0A9P6QBP1_9FUNG|nr:hypothetical protein BG011_000320 [Mortierella polycephala]
MTNPDPHQHQHQHDSDQSSNDNTALKAAGGLPPTPNTLHHPHASQVSYDSTANRDTAFSNGNNNNNNNNNNDCSAGQTKPFSTLPSHPSISTTTSSTLQHQQLTSTTSRISGSDQREDAPVNPTLSTVVDERCRALLESELSTFTLRGQQHQQSEQQLPSSPSSSFSSSSSSSATVHEKHLSQSLQTLKHQHERTLAHLSKAQTDVASLRTQLDEKEQSLQQLQSRMQERTQELKEVLLDRDSLSQEMMECHTDNAKFLKRLRGSSDAVERLQIENRHLIDQLRESRAKVAEISEAKARVTVALERERSRAQQAALDLERVVVRYKDEVERMQDLVLAMGHKHVQVQAQFSSLQQAHARAQSQAQAQAPSQALDQEEQKQPLAIVAGESTVTQEQGLFDLTTVNRPSSTTASTSSTKASSLPSQKQQHESFVLGDGALASILTSIASSTHSRRSKPTRRFTVNASSNSSSYSHNRHQAFTPLTLEQRKHEFLMDQITVLQRGYDSVRQEKITLELQLDMVQKQHQYNEQQRHKRQDSERKALGHHYPQKDIHMPAHQQNYDNLPHYQLSCASKGQSPDNTDYTDIQQQHHKRITEQGEEKQYHGAPSITEEDTDARKEAERVKQVKALQIQETLASLESRHDGVDRSNSHGSTASSHEELKHLGHLRSRIESAGADAVSSVSKSTRSSPSTRQQTPLQQQLLHSPHMHHQQHHHRPFCGYDQVEWDVQQCSCCMGGLIEL